MQNSFENSIQRTKKLQINFSNSNYYISNIVISKSSEILQKNEEQTQQKDRKKKLAFAICFSPQF